MSINLLPGEEAQQQLIRRRTGIAAFLLVALWAGLGAAGLAQLNLVADRTADRDAAAARVEQVRGQVGSLAVFQRMADDAAAGNAVLSFAMADEVSWAQLLIDLSRGVPESASYTQVSGQLADPVLPGAVSGTAGLPAADPGELTESDVGFFTIGGYTREIFTPGLEDLLRRFGSIDGFEQQYLSAAQLDSIGDVPVTSFSAEVRLDDSARTHRYVDGLPEREG